MQPLEMLYRDLVGAASIIKSSDHRTGILTALPKPQMAPIAPEAPGGDVEEGSSMHLFRPSIVR